jgi:hypothetical protein
MNRYTKMYGWLYNTFGTTVFTIDDFRMNFPSPQPTKTIHDLIRLEFIKRKKRGAYQIVKPEDYVKKIVKENTGKTDSIQQAKKPYAYTDSTAVNIWTDGYYWTDFTKGFKPIHITVLKKDVPYWKHFFISHDTEYIMDGEHKTLFGVTYIVHPKDTITIETKNDSAVVPLKEIITYCQNNMLLYRPALEYLDKKYHLHLFDSYEQMAS